MGKVFEPTYFPIRIPETLSSLDESSFDYLVGGLEALFGDINYGSGHSILPVLDRLSEGLKFDSKWANTLHAYVFNFMTRKVGDVDYAEFFGSPYVGLQRVNFTTGDRNEWFTEVFDVDEADLKEHLHANKLISKTWNVVGDVFNLTIPYLLYRAFHSKDLTDTLKHRAMVDIIMMYHCKCLTSILSNDYRYLARKEVAHETYKRLSLKYDIKRYGSWRALIEARAEFIINPKTGIHYKTFTQMTDDKKIIYMVGDIQDRLRGLINDINKVFHVVKNDTNLTSLVSSNVKLEDGIGVRDVTKEVSAFRNHLLQSLSSESFFKQELVEYASKVMGHSPQDKLEYIIKQFPAQYNSPKGEKYRWFIDEVLTHLFDYLYAKNIRPDNLKTVLFKMRGAYLSSGAGELREVGDGIIKDLTGIKTPITISSLRTSLMLYIDLRALAMNHYQ